MSLSVSGGYAALEYVDPAERDTQPSHIKIYRYIPRRFSNYECPPSDWDFTTGLSRRLHPTISLMIDGEVRQIDHYEQATMNADGSITYTDLIVREEFVYTRDSIGFALYRTQKITWFREDGTAHPDTKTRLKLYERDERMREGQRRRANITDKLAMDLSEWLVATQTQEPDVQKRIDMGRAFMRAHKIGFDMFVDAAAKDILYEIRDDTNVAHAWLDQEKTTGVTVRKWMIDVLNIWDVVV